MVLFVALAFSVVSWAFMDNLEISDLLNLRPFRRRFRFRATLEKCLAPALGLLKHRLPVLDRSLANKTSQSLLVFQNSHAKMVVVFEDMVYTRAVGAPWPNRLIF